MSQGVEETFRRREVCIEARTEACDFGESVVLPEDVV
jgi:hypothetical protein